jgi:hypothetical protein
LDFYNPARSERAECLNRHTAFAEVENDAVSFEDRGIRDQLNDEQLACEERVATFPALFGTSL